jgi:antitoxin component of MazEF toxin-antitoxin module
MSTIDTNLTTSGNSAAVRLPRELLRMSGISAKSKVTLEAKRGKIIISKASNAREGWGPRINELAASEKDPTREFKDMGAANGDGLDDLPWDGPSFEDWQKMNGDVS